MAKTPNNPIAHEDYQARAKLGTESDFKAWLGEDAGKVRSSWDDLRPWREKLAHFLARRYGLLYRQPTKPWRNSANIIMPLMDKTIGQLDPLFHNLVFAHGRIVRAEALDPAGIQNAHHFELWQNSLYAGIVPRFSIPDFVEQQSYNISYLTQYGLGAWHVEWSHRTEAQRRMLTPTNLPGMVADLGIVPDLTNEERNIQIAEDAQRGLPKNPLGLRKRFFPDMPEPPAVNPINRDFFDAHSETIKEIVEEGFELDPKDKVERKTRDDIMSWLREGARERRLVVKFRKTVEETARPRAIHPADFIVPRGTWDLQRARTLTIREHWTHEEVLHMAHDQDWPDDAVEKALESATERGPLGERDEMRIVEKRLSPDEDIHGTMRDDNTLEFWRRYRWEDVDGDGLPERLELIYEPNSLTPLAVRELPYNHGRWPVSMSRFEYIQPSIHSVRGAPEIMHDSDLYLTAAHRAKLNQWMLSTGRMFFIRRGSSLDQEGLRFGPIVVARTESPNNDVREIPPNLAGNQWVEEELFHQQWVQGHIGTVTADLTADSKLTRPRTATEMNIRTDDRRRIMGMRATQFLRGQGEMYRLVAATSQQYTPDRFVAQITGEDPQELQREMVQGEFTVFPVPVASSMDPDAQAQKAMVRAQFLINTAPVINGSTTHTANVVQAVKEALDAEDIGASKRLMPERPDEDRIQVLAQKLLQARDAAQMGDMASRVLQNNGVTPQELAAVVLEAIKRSPFKDMTNLVEEGSAAVTEAEGDLASAVSDGVSL